MTNSNQKELQKLINQVLNSCEGASWEKETISNLSVLLKELGMRDILIEKFLKNHNAQE